MEGLSHHTRVARAHKTRGLRARNRVVCWGVFHVAANSMREFLQVNKDLEKTFDSVTTPSNMRAPGTDTGFQLEPDMHASQNLASNMNNAR
jgi:hypothetical protein